MQMYGKKTERKRFIFQSAWLFISFIEKQHFVQKQTK